METSAETKVETAKFDYYMPMANPTANKAYQLIKWYEKEILFLIAFTTPDLELRKQMDKTRDKMKHIVCRNCVHLGETSHKLRTANVLEKDDDLSEKYGIPIETDKEPIKVVKVLTERVVDTVGMACEGCRALRLKQIATGYFKGRRFKQV